MRYKRIIRSHYYPNVSKISAKWMSKLLNSRPRCLCQRPRSSVQIRRADDDNDHIRVQEMTKRPLRNFGLDLSQVTINIVSSITYTYIKLKTCIRTADIVQEDGSYIEIGRVIRKHILSFCTRVAYVALLYVFVLYNLFTK